jgi:serine/threonine protein kinase
VDVWAVGCILYEIVVGKKAFPNDMAVSVHDLTAFQIPVDANVVPDPGRKQVILEAILAAMQVEPAKRPAASKLYETFLSWEPSDVLKSSDPTAVRFSEPDPTGSLDQQGAETENKAVALRKGAFLWRRS